MLNPGFSNPSQRLIESRFDDVEYAGDQDHSTLKSSFRRILTKRRVAIICGIIVSVLLIIGFTLTGVFVSRANNNKSFNKNLTNHVNSNFPSIDNKLKDSYIKELSKYHEERLISHDHVLEFETLLKFEDFIKDFKRVHASNDERKERFLIFRTNYFDVRSHKGHETYSKEINNYSDMSAKEFKKLFPPLKVPKTASPKDLIVSEFKNRAASEKYLENLALAKTNGRKITNPADLTGESLDWRKANGVTKVKDQGLCGSCWAFASVGSIESLYKIQEDKTLDLSEQELVDCDFQSNGCGGGFGDTALEYVKNKGISYTTDLPYHAKDQKCSVKSKNKVFINSFMVTKGLDILNKSLVLSPTIVYIGATNELTMYKSGIYNGPCAKELNHAVLLVGEGYDEQLGKRFWIIKNSWGPYWGEGGFLRLERTNKGTDMCGVLETGITPML